MDIFAKDKKSKKTFLTLKGLFISSGLLQGIAMVLTIPLFRDLFSGNYSKLWIWLLCIGIAAVLGFIVHLKGFNLGNHMAVWEVCDAQIHRVGGAITKLPLGWFDASSKGKISKAITTDINTISHYPPIVLPEILTTVSASAVIIAALLFISLKYGIILIVMGVFMFIFWKKNIKSMAKVEEEGVRANQKMESTIVEFAQLQPVLRASGALVDGWDRLDTALTHDKEAAIKKLKSKSKNTSRYMFTINIGAILILVLSAYEFLNGGIEIYTFAGIVVAMMRVANPLAMLLPYGSEIFNIRESLGRINQIVNAHKLPEPELSAEAGSMDKGLGIELKDVDFSYVKGTQVLKDVNLTIPAGSITALVGPSGSGKSTINRLIARFWDVERGEVLINGQNIKNFRTENLMEMVSMVFQEVYLFNTTIRENVAIAKPDAAEEEILNAAKRARLDEVVERLPNGWDTMVGEGGSSLSGGEKQRVSIARAFLKNAPILLLDEITSALDGVNEAVITKSLQELSKDRTVVVIAHRLSSIKNADSIAVIDDGRITGCGTHKELLESNDKYKNLWNALVSIEDWKM